MMKNEYDSHTEGKLNFLLADGHVTAMTPIASFTDDNGKVVSTSNVSGSKWDAIR